MIVWQHVKHLKLFTFHVQNLAHVWCQNIMSIITLVNSGCKCPSIGKAEALKIRGELFEGPGPIRSFCGITIGFKRLCGGLETELIFDFAILKRQVFLHKTFKTIPVRGRKRIRSFSIISPAKQYWSYNFFFLKKSTEILNTRFISLFSSGKRLRFLSDQFSLYQIQQNVTGSR